MRHSVAARIGLVLVMLSMASGAAAQANADSGDTSRQFLRRNSASMAGLPGLVLVPVAGATPSGAVDFTFDGARAPDIFANLGHQRNAMVVIGFLPRLTLGARGTVAPDTLHHFEWRDLSANVQLALLREGPRRPALSIGMQDIGQGATPFFPSKFLVATKSLLGGASVTAGYGTGPAVLNGAFGGVSVGIGQWATALGEYDSRHVNAGLRIFPFPAVADRLGLQPRLDISWRQHSGTAIGAGLRTRLGGNGEARRRPEPTAQTPDATAPHTARMPVMATPAATAAVLRTAGTRAAEEQLVAMGFENVRVAIASPDAGPTIAVEYENRRFNRDELDALGIVMAVAAEHAADSVRRMRVTIRRVNLPVMTVESDVATFISFVQGRISDPAFAGQLMITRPAASGWFGDPGSSAPDAAPMNPSTWKLDLFIRPRVETTFLTDLGVADARVSVLPDAYVQLGRGLVVNARRAIPVTTTQTFPVTLEDPNADRLLVHQALRVPIGGRPDGADAWGGPGTGVLTQFSVGRFGHESVGLANELDVSFSEGRLSLGSTFAVLGRSFGTLDHTMALGVARLRQPAWDLTASLTAGRFLRGDVGAMAEISRFFGSTEVAFSLQSTDFASAAGVRIAIPLTPARELSPRRIRPRLPDVQVQELRSTVLDPRPVLRGDVARLLDTQHEIGRAYLIRDRLQPATVRAHVETLRAAARRWVGSIVFPVKPNSEFK